MLKKKYSFEINIFKIGSPYSRVFLKKNTCFFFCKKYAKNALYLGKFRKKKNWSGTTFLLKMSKKPRRCCNFQLAVKKSDRIFGIKRVYYRINRSIKCPRLSQKRSLWIVLYLAAARWLLSVGWRAPEFKNLETVESIWSSNIWKLGIMRVLR